METIVALPPMVAQECQVCLNPNGVEMSTVVLRWKGDWEGHEYNDKT
jgi:hypothetical protein